ncbi:hypothetical protein ACLOJK_025951 [Asimina triloba]
MNDQDHLQEMPEKAILPVSNGHIFLSNSFLWKGLPSLTAAIFVAVIIFWSVDSCTVRSLRNRQDYLSLQPDALLSASPLPHNSTQESESNSTVSSTFTNLGFPQNVMQMTNTAALSPAQVPLNNILTPEQNPAQAPPLLSSASTRQNTTDSALDHTQDSTRTPPLAGTTSLPQNQTVNAAVPDQESTQKPSLLSWISLKLEPNFTANLLAQWVRPGGEPCLDNRSENIKIPALDGQDYIELSAGEIHEFTFSAYDGSGIQRCSGGDYFETDLSGETWKSRPPVKDLTNGTYSMSLQIHPDYAGEYNLTIFLLFRSFEGLKFSPARFHFRRELRRIQIKFVRASSQFPEIQTCKRADFNQDIWSGRWTRHANKDDCDVDQDGRYRCLRADYPCQSPWCDGYLGLLESNGWVYSAHCSFRIFTTDSAWKCLKDRWIFFWGDSNHVDTIRNLLNFVLGHPEIPAVPRRFDNHYTNPKIPSERVRITSIFNGHWNASLNYEGLNSLQNEKYRNLLRRFFSGETVPDTMIFNSGLHDGVHWRTLRAFTGGAEYAAQFWDEVFRAIHGNKTRLIYRNTIATGGYARDLAFNPNKMEAFNLVLLEKLRDRGLVSSVIDDFDMTFPWHYDNRCNDGVHYGKGPMKAKWRDGIVGHQYFVDLMLAHVLLNAICAGE